MVFQTKEEIEKISAQTRFLVSTISNLMENLKSLCNQLKSNRAGLRNHLENIQVTLSEAKELFTEQIALYTLLAKQSALPDVEAAEETLEKIKGKEHEIIMIKGRLNYQTSVLPQFLIVAEEIKELAEPEKANLVAIQQELELVSK
ncbi:MAG: hypothetical protein NTW67_03020 [Candidatus Woesearchaeota archaeon]|nr:hypothetical protein [Candidatus Woesearchaeota archaeon]